MLNKTYDVGFIRTGQLEKMVKEGTLLNLDGIHIVEQADDDFHFPHTTRLYPEWPFAALADTDPELEAAVQAALLQLSAEHPSMVNANATGFVEGIDYQPLHNLIELLELRSHDAE